ncbi:hypothetical protein ATL17_0292 [Maritalea mobilis]|uniref:DoxX-like protein n=1 Tax=Maritalea mobilis TaxID=483324 RepID=A0A4R6VQK2_9HYPH|nr:hypothetical protein [Maritalea mobilis]TDQ66299.1 hypothetical protein ATL17_0292 [Maritalea mobilis]
MSISESKVEKQVAAAIAGLIILQVVMLGSLYAQIEPHPPAIIPISGIGPFLSVSLSAAVGALMLGPLHSRAGRVLGLIAALLAMISFGPQKYIDPQFPLVWPAVVFGQMCAAYIAFANIRHWRS